MASHLWAWAPHATSEALRIVRNVLKSSGSPMSPKEIFKHAVAQVPEHPVDPPPPIIYRERRSGSVKQVPYPPHPEHPIRSYRYLKTVVLPAMEHRYEIEKFHTKAPLSASEIQGRLASLSKNARKAKEAAITGTLQDVWLWRVRTTPPSEVEEKAKRKVETKVLKVVGSEVGAGRDMKHLNRRRLNAREKKVKKAVKFMNAVQHARSGGGNELQPPAMRPPPKLSARKKEVKKAVKSTTTVGQPRKAGSRGGNELRPPAMRRTEIRRS
ncbi:hypothetical protein OE88DRAFT_1665775 [Heliocybe sulcata]|uniref:Uncharacterized protein n=1 Tax=Heliocybe sulcata TaxID=5364 RepID=A0A5C3N1H3_9AGAM|nr:hypothetical protein OE88DRAFT_1665775 [Heliocybe sulcata]